MSPSAIPRIPERTPSSNSLLRGQATGNSPPRLAPAEGEAALANANRAIAAAGEAIMELDGVEDLIIDDGWETEDSGDFTDIDDDDDLSGFGGGGVEAVEEEDSEEEDGDGDDDDDDDDDDLIQLIGHR